MSEHLACEGQQRVLRGGMLLRNLQRTVGVGQGAVEVALLAQRVADNGVGGFQLRLAVCKVLVGKLSLGTKERCAIR